MPQNSCILSHAPGFHSSTRPPWLAGVESGRREGSRQNASFSLRDEIRIEFHIGDRLLRNYADRNSIPGPATPARGHRRPRAWPRRRLSSPLPRHTDVQLVGIADADPSPFAKYQKKYSLPETLFFKSMANMIEVRHPQAVLVYTSIARAPPRHRDRRPVRRLRHGREAPHHLARRRPRHPRRRPPTTTSRCWSTTRPPGTRATAPPTTQLQNGSLGDIRRVVVHDGHQGPKEIGVPPEFLDLAHRSRAERRRRSLRLRLLRRRPHDLAHARRNPAHRHRRCQSRQAARSIRNVDDDATIVLQYPRAQAVIQASWNWPFGRKDMEVYGATGYAITVGTDRVCASATSTRCEEHTVTAPPLPEPERDSLSYLAAVLRGQIVPKGDLTALDTNVVVMQILDAARTSVRTGQSVHLHQVE